MSTLTELDSGRTAVGKLVPGSLSESEPVALRMPGLGQTAAHRHGDWHLQAARLLPKTLDAYGSRRAYGIALARVNRGGGAGGAP